MKKKKKKQKEEDIDYMAIIKEVFINIGLILRYFGRFIYILVFALIPKKQVEIIKGLKNET